ncbi:MAG TPA: hypothetical protein VNN07_19015, partial [Candidatus Tectomicrobia bacterium]|nr:hypothetical protein [Candidatus Tectomicrobia bacterium]
MGDAAGGSADPGLIEPRRLARAVALAAIAGAAVLAVAAVLSLGLALAQHASVGRLVGGILGVPVVGLVALVVGGAYGSTRALRRQLPIYEAAIGRVVQPLLAQLAARVPLPPEGLAPDAFD